MDIPNSTVVPFFKKLNVKLADVKSEHIQAFYQKRLNEDGVSSNTVWRNHANIHKALRYAVTLRKLAFNPADAVTLPKKKKYVPSFYSEEELNSLLAVFENTELETVVLLTAHYGFRRSEVLGLKWESIDFTQKTITVNNKVVKMKLDGKMFLYTDSELKNEESRRTLPLIDQVADHLLSVKHQQQLDQLRCGPAYDRQFDGYVCRNPDGTLIDPDHIENVFPDCLERYGLRRIRFYDLRHSCVTLLHSLGIPLKDIQLWIGHASLNTTTNICTRFI